MNIVMIAVHKRGNKVIGFRLLDTDSKSVKDVPYDNLKVVLINGSVTIENIKVEGDRIVGTNGTLQRYAVLVNKCLVGTSPLVILFELVNNCYRVANCLGQIADMTENEIVQYGKTEGIANGKLVPDENGVMHLSSIQGTYKQDQLVLDKQYGSILSVKMKMLGVYDYELDENYMATVINKDIEEVHFGKGVLGINTKGCAGLTKLKKVYFPDTLDTLNQFSFANCKSLQEITIPEGVKVIPFKCFASCSNLKVVNLPNSIRKIDKLAFFNCNKLKIINCGPVPIDIAFGAIPNGVKRVQRSR